MPDTAVQLQSRDLLSSALLLALLALALLLIFAWFPQLDLAVSALFYDAGFAGRHQFIAQLVYDSVYLAFAAAALLIAFASWRAVNGRYSWRTPSFLLMALLLGPGLLVNFLLKEFSGRARPDVIVNFGGDKLFTPPWQFTDQCLTNCSFVSGHASMGFYFVALAFVFAPSRRAFWIYLACGWLLGLIFGMFRVYQGRHFFSDVLWSGLVVSFSCYVLYLLFFRVMRAKPDSST